MRALFAALLTFAIALPARAQQAPPEGPPPSFDEPTPKAPAQPEAPAQPAPPKAPAPPEAPAQRPPPPAAPPPAPVAPKVGADGFVDEIIPNPSKKWGFAFAGAAAGCFVIGGILGGVALSREGEQTGDVKNPPLYTGELLDRGKAAQAMAGTAYGFYALGAALAIVDVVLWIETFRKPRVIRRPASEVTVTPTGTQF